MERFIELKSAQLEEIGEPPLDAQAVEEDEESTEEMLTRLRKGLTDSLVMPPDTFHPFLKHVKTLFKRFRGLLDFLYRETFAHGRAQAGVRLSMGRYILAALRLAYDDEVRTALLSAYEASQKAGPGMADPRIEALVALLEFHAPLSHMWQMAHVHGPLSILRSAASRMLMVRA